jgi:inorganic pyrophosphatase
MNPWHDVSLGKDAPNVVQAIIEIPKGSKIKYEMCKESGLILVDRILRSSVHYPANYGFLPQTYCDDKDPLDILVLGTEPVVPMSIMRAIPIGVMKMVDQGEEDDKIIAVHADDPEYGPYVTLEQLPPHRAREIERFFLDYKLLEKKKVEVKGIHGRDVALKVIEDAKALYRKYRAEHP